MNFKFMCLGNDITPDIEAAQTLILKDFSQAYEGDFAFTDYGSELDFIKGLNEAVEADDIILLSTKADYFLAFKNFIASQFHFKCKPHKTVQRLIVGTYPELEKELVRKQAMMPSKADVIISQDGLYSGYAIRTDTQIMFVLPLDPTRLDFLLEDGVFPYLRDNLDVSSVREDDALEGAEPVGGGKKKKAPKAKRRTAWNGIPEAPKQEGSTVTAAAAMAAAGTEEQPADTGDAFFTDQPAEFNRQYIEDVTRKLREKNATVAVADTKTVDFLRKMQEEGVDFDGVLHLTDYTLDREDRTADGYAIALARGAFEANKDSIGASVTKVYATTGKSGDSEYNIYASISDGSAAKAAKIAGEPGETPPHLIYRAIEVLFHMMALWAENGNIDAAGDAAPKKRRKPKKSKKKTKNKPAPLKTQKAVRKEAARQDRPRRIQRIVAESLIGASAVAGVVVAIVSSIH